MMRDNLAADINAAARLYGRFKLRSGRESSEYFDKYRFEADPRLLARLADRMIPLLPEGTQRLAGLELGGVPIATALSLKTGLPAVFVRKEAKTYGTCQAVEGGDIAGQRTVLIEDVITTGGAVADAAAQIRAAGGIVLGVVCAIWRGEGSPAIAGEPGLPVISVLTKTELDAAA
jgi:orotate phosphoribosyltransferase